VEENQELSVVFDKSNLHLFDIETDKALAHGLSEPVSVDTSVDGSADTEVGSDDD